MITLNILGSADLRGDDGRAILSVLSRPRRLTLLSYLTLNAPGTFIPRERLLPLFWPNSEPGRGRASLRTALSGLRTSLGTEVLTARGDNEVGIAADSISCDAAEFEAAFDLGNFDSAWAIYGGTLLESISMPDYPALDRWVEDERARLKRKAIEAAVGLSERSAADEELGDAVRWARESLSLEPLSEIGIRRVIRLLDRVGDRRGALRAYKSFSARLNEELDLEPSVETTALVDAIRSTVATQTTQQIDAATSPVAVDAVEDRPVAHSSAQEPPELSGVRRPFPLPRAILAGVGAFALLGLGVAGYFVMQTTGIGQASELAAVAVVAEGERVLLADFADGTGEGFAAAVTEALRIDLLESTVVTLVEVADIEPTLRLMQLDPGSGLTAERARDVARLQGVPAVIDGRVVSVGAGYILTATLRAAETGRSLASFRVTAADVDGIIGSIDELSQSLRARSGEPLGTIQGGTPLEQATTPSFDALRLYTEAFEVFDRGDAPAATRFLNQALAHDSTFAMAWRLLSLVGGGRQAIDKAFQYRGRLRDDERYVVEGLYYSRSGDRAAAMEAYQNALTVNPREVRALNNLAGMHRGLSGLDRAIELYRRASADPRRRATPHGNLIGTLIFADSLDAAAAELRSFEDAHPGHPMQVGLHFALSFAQGDLISAAAHAGQRFDDVNRLDDARHARYQGRLAHWAGRFVDARDLYLREEALRAREDIVSIPQGRGSAAYETALVGDTAWARSHIQEGSPTVGGPDAALTLAYTGNAQAAADAIGAWKKRSPERSMRPWAVNRSAWVELYARVASGDTAGAAEAVPGLLLEAGCSDNCWLFDRARLRDQLDERQLAVELFERVRRPGYSYGSDSDDVNVGERLYAMLRLGPLYEELGEPQKAIEAYQRIVDQWADADARGQETVTRFRERIAALGSG